MTKSEHVRHFGFLVFPGFPMACLTSAIEPLRAANEITGARGFRWTVLAEERAPVASSAEVMFEPGATLSEARGLDALFLLSGPTAHFAHPRASIAALRLLARQGVRLGGVSGGVFPLARAGLLADVPVAVHWCYDAAFRAEFPDLDARSEVMRIERGRVTVAGATAVFDLMLSLIEEDMGPEVMTEVACWFQHPVVRGPDVIQRQPGWRADRTQDTLPVAIARAIGAMGTHVADPLTIADLADRVGLSARQFDRTFRAATGQAPLRYYRMVRMKKARQLVQFSDAPLSEVAEAVGYATTGPLARHYAAEFGLSPQEDRAARNLFREGGTRVRHRAEG